MRKPIYSKVKAGVAGGGVATLIATILVSVAKAAGYEMDLQTAVFIAGIIVTLLGGLSGYLKTETVQ